MDEAAATEIPRLIDGYQISQAIHVAVTLGIADLLEGRDAKFSDLNMLVGPGGRERARAEYAELFRQSGFVLTDVFNAGVYSVNEETLA